MTHRMGKPLQGYHIIELAGIEPFPYAGMLMANMGADVVMVNRPGFAVRTVHDRSKTSITINFHQSGGG